MNTKPKRKRTSIAYKLSCSLIIFLIPLLFFGQKIDVRGTIIDGVTKASLPGVTITIKNSTDGAISDYSGNYQIKAATGDIAVFSFLGYATVEKKITGNILNISLQETSKTLNEVVVIGYGSTKKKDLTGSVTQVNAKEFQKGFVTNAEQLIANKVPGLQITPVSGKPGAGSSFLLRGGASLSASNNPLFVIDGVPIGLSDGPGVISALNPDDIASFSILKDASAAAIYGSRGSNGVIIITTKAGGKGDLKVSFVSKFSASSNIYKQDLLSGDQYREVAKQASIVAGVPISDFKLGTANTDWQDEIYQTALTYDNSISFTGGIKALPYRFSYGFLDQDGTLKTGNFKRNTVTLNINPTFFDDHLKVNLNVKGISQKERRADESAIYTAVTFDPTQSVKDPNSIYGGYWQYSEFASNPAVLHGHNNPVSILEQVQDRTSSLRSIGNLQLDYKVHSFPDLSIKINSGYDVANGTWDYYAPANYFPVSISNGYVSKGDLGYKTENVFSETTLNYSKEIKSIDSRIEALAGYSYNDFKTTNYFYPSYDVDGNVQPGSKPNFNFDIPQNTLISYFGRLIYTFKDKYVLTGTYRTDGSSRFSPKTRWGSFPSVSGAWKINDEKFLVDSKVISNLKFRIGWGVTGQQEGIGNYGYIPIYNLGASNIKYPIGNNFIQGVDPSATDRNRKWEQSTTSNIGLDWGLFSNRIYGSFDVYHRVTDDLLNDVTIPSGTDFANNIVKNIGSLENRGLEVNVNALLVKKGDFDWNLGVNYSYNENKITKLSVGDDSGVGLLSGNILVNSVGYSRNTFFVYHQVYNAQGKPIEDQMVDLNNDGLINEKDRYRTESSSPKHIIGFNTAFNYKKLALGMAFHSNLGQYVFYKPNDNLSAIYSGLTRNNIDQSYFETGFTQAGNVNQQYSDYYLQDASFLKMDNINLSYDFGNLINPKKDNNKVILSASVQNVFVITDFTGGDPEASYNWGSNNGAIYTAPRTYSLSLNLNF
ncbi:iron complex outermembrane receptor protein [Flavobacterium sp. 1]|uniref:SusC/RagA family TonB-linked outer membrane protein n=1 Tax=Flavobacterium sp. 1 TaxID=2035200 RepID=UPI000C23E576|nr:TonB-dependent receptor [Flavobacterium sp. 1]PJJ09718.1 iron complex outermembrane receptor protein [Flavobacterium sp. 1]